MQQTDKLKQFVLEHGAQLVGIAPVSRFEGAPEGKRPTDILPDAKSVVVIGIRLVDGALQSVFRAVEDGKKYLHGLYGTYCSALVSNMKLGNLTLETAKYIENEMDGVAVPTANGPYQFDSAFSQRRAAIAAGLGEMGVDGYVITPKYGPRVRFCSVITNVDLEADEMYKGEKLCNPEICDICRKACPTAALGELVHTTIGGKDIAYYKRDICRCKLANYGLVKETAVPDTPFTKPPKKLDHDLNNLSEEYILEQVHDMPAEGFSTMMYANWKCELCMIYCPTGGWKERFADRGISKGEEAIKR